MESAHQKASYQHTGPQIANKMSRKGPAYNYIHILNAEAVVVSLA